MVRLLSIVAVLAALVLGAFAALSLSITEDEVRAAVALRVRVLTGYDLAVAGDAKLDLFPRLNFRLDDVKLRVPGDIDGTPLAAMDSLSGSLRLLPLLTGRAFVESITLHRPRFVLRVDANGRRSWITEQGLIEAAVNRPGLLPPREIPIGDVRIEDGSILYEDHRKGIRREVTAIAGTVSWPHLGAALSASGSLDWRGETTQFGFAAESPLAYLGGRPTGTTLSLRSNVGDLSFSGTADPGRKIQLDGRLNLMSPTAGEFLRWVGSDVPLDGRRHQMALGGKLSLVGGEAELSEVELTIDGNSGRGSLSADIAAAEPNVQGTLAFERLDLNTFLPRVASGDGGSKTEADRRRLDISGLDQVAADIRVSASSIVFGPLALGRTAATLTIREGRLTLGIGQTEIEGGTGIGTFTAFQAPEGVQARVSLSASGLDMAGIAAMLGAGGRISGRGETTLDLTGTGGTLHDLLADLRGEASIALSNGTIAGIDAVQALSAIDAGAMPDFGDGEGTTEFDRLSARFSVASGIASTRNFRMESPALAVAANVDLDLGEGRIEAKGTAELLSRTGAGAIVAVPFVVEGPILSPLIYPDPDWLLRRGGGSIQETIDSLIERHR